MLLLFMTHSVALTILHITLEALYLREILQTWRQCEMLTLQPTILKQDVRKLYLTKRYSELSKMCLTVVTE